MYGPGPVPFNDGCAVASMDMSTKCEVILLTSEGPNGAKQAKLELAGLATTGGLGVGFWGGFWGLLL
jgi:hypothetical protein